MCVCVCVCVCVYTGMIDSRVKMWKIQIRRYESDNQLISKLPDDLINRTLITLITLITRLIIRLIASVFCVIFILMIFHVYALSMGSSVCECAPWFYTPLICAMCVTMCCYI